MSIIVMRLDDADEAILRRYAQKEGKSVADFMRDAAFQKVESRQCLAAFHGTLAEDDAAQLVQRQVLAELRL